MFVIVVMSLPFQLVMVTAINKILVEVIADPFKATLLIVNNVLRTGTETAWIACMMGLRIVEPKYLLSKGHYGAALGYQPAFQRPRSIWLSTEFIKEHAKLTRIIRIGVECTNVLFIREYDFLKMSLANLDRPVHLLNSIPTLLKFPQNKFL